jgi:hypothetical protein
VSKNVFDEYNTVFGRVDAVRVSNQNMTEVAAWCGGEVRIFPVLDTPEPECYIALTSTNTHLRSELDRAEVGEWIVENKDGDPRRIVWADKLFLSLLTDRVLDEEKHDRVSKILAQLMEYQDYVTGKGGGTEETVSAAELAALQIGYEFR